MGYQQLYKKAQNEVYRLQELIEINKQVMENLLLQNKESEEKYKDEIIILNKIISDHHKLHTEEVQDLKERLEHTKDALEMKEYLLQEKENKWKEFEDVVVAFASNHPDLQEKLCQIDYLWDEITSKRKISNVVKENSELKIKITSLQSQLSEVVSNMTSGDDDNDARYNFNYNSEPCSVKNLRMNKLRFPQQDKSERRFQSGNMTPQNMLLAPPVKPEFRRSRFGSTQILYEESSNSTDEGSGMGKGSGIMQTENYKNNIEVVPLEQESRHNSQQDVPLKDIDESSISLDDCAMLENSHPSQMYFDRDEVLDECLEVLSQNAPKEDFDHFGDAI